MSKIGGARAHRNGEAFEALIERACARYERAGLAFLQKTPEPMRPLRPLKGGQFVAIFTKSAQPDYSGCIRGGRHVVFEAKHTDGDRIDQTRVTEEQAANFDRHEALGAICFVLVSFRFAEFFRVPWASWRNMREEFGKKSIRACDIEMYRVDILNFLRGII